MNPKKEKILDYKTYTKDVDRDSITLSIVADALQAVNRILETEGVHLQFYAVDSHDDTSILCCFERL